MSALPSNCVAREVPGVAVANCSDNLDLIRRRLIGPKIECASAAQIELCMMPLASEHSIFDGPLTQWEAHVRTTIIQGKDLSVMPANQNRTKRSRNGQHSLLLD